MKSLEEKFNASKDLYENENVYDYPVSSNRITFYPSEYEELCELCSHRLLTLDTWVGPLYCESQLEEGGLKFSVYGRDCELLQSVKIDPSKEIVRIETDSNTYELMLLRGKPAKVPRAVE